MLFKKQITANIRFSDPLLIVYSSVNKRIVGSMTCTVDNQNDIISIGDIRCDICNKGYGSLMMKTLIEYGKQNNYKSIEGWISQVDIDHINRLHHFYQKFGFDIIPNKNGDKIEDIILRL